MDETASNFDPNNIFPDNGQCVYATTFQVDMSCPFNPGALLNGSTEINDLFVTGPLLGGRAMKATTNSPTMMETTSSL